MKSWKERTLWALAVCGALGLWATVQAQGINNGGVPPLLNGVPLDGWIAYQADIGNAQHQHVTTLDLAGRTSINLGSIRRVPGGYSIPFDITTVDARGWDEILDRTLSVPIPGTPRTGKSTARC